MIKIPIDELIMKIIKKTYNQSNRDQSSVFKTVFYHEKYYTDRFSSVLFEDNRLAPFKSLLNRYRQVQSNCPDKSKDS